MSDTVPSAAGRVVDGATVPVAGTWNFDTTHSTLEFSVRHLMVGKVRGRFTSWSGAAHVAEDPKDSWVEVEVDLSSVDTNDDKRDEHLRSSDFFDVEGNKFMTFKSTKVEGKGDHWTVTGDLTLNHVTKPVVLDLEVGGVVEKDPWGLARAGFDGETEINREEFGVSYNAPMEAGGLLIGKNVKVKFEVEAVKA
jgi:polyisoprenoid-binding protein YceI